MLHIPGEVIIPNVFSLNYAFADKNCYLATNDCIGKSKKIISWGVLNRVL